MISDKAKDSEHGQWSGTNGQTKGRRGSSLRRRALTHPRGSVTVPMDDEDEDEDEDEFATNLKAMASECNKDKHQIRHTNHG